MTIAVDLGRKATKPTNQPIRRLQAQNTALQRNISGKLYIEKRCKDTEQSRVGEVQVKPADTLQLEDEIRRLQAQNTALQRNISGKLYIEKRCSDTEQSRVGEVQVKPADTLHLEDEIRRLQAQNTALQRNISGIFIYREEV